MSATDWVEQLKGIALDLTTIEVNTIEADCMTGRKMPALRLALIDVARNYADFLTGPRIGLDFDAFARPFANLSCGEMPERSGAATVLTGPRGFVHHETERAGTVDPAVLLTALRALPVKLTREPPVDQDTTRPALTLQLTNGPETFLCLQWAAANVLPHLVPPEGAPPAAKAEIETNRVIVQRIQRNCEQLRGLSRALLRHAREDGKGQVKGAEGALASLPKDTSGERIGFTRLELERVDIGGETVPKAPAELLNRLRKAWDIGTDRIVLQTVIQLDGDAIYRASREILDSRHHPVALAHERITKLALDHWGGLFKLLTDLMLSRSGQVLGSDYKSRDG